MAAKLRKETVAYQNKLKYIAQYAKNNVKKYIICVNTNTEKELNEYLAGMTNRATYIKGLILADMRRNKGEN